MIKTFLRTNWIILNTNETEEKECVGDECLINDGKEIVERVDKVYKTNDGRQLLM